jgi:hypothetical protein
VIDVSDVNTCLLVTLDGSFHHAIHLLACGRADSKTMADDELSTLKRQPNYVNIYFAAHADLVLGFNACKRIVIERCAARICNEKY